MSSLSTCKMYRKLLLYRAIKIIVFRKNYNIIENIMYKFIMVMLDMRREITLSKIKNCCVLTAHFLHDMGMISSNYPKCMLMVKFETLKQMYAGGVMPYFFQVIILVTIQTTCHHQVIFKPTSRVWHVLHTNVFNANWHHKIVK